MELKSYERNKVVDLLLQCKSLEEPEARQKVINDLPSEISHTAVRHNQPLTDISNLLEACLSQTDGLQEFLKVLSFYEKKSKEYRTVVAYLHKRWPDQNFDSGEEQSSFRRFSSPLEQKYLKRLVEQIRWVNLAQIVPEQADRIELEKVYVDSPTSLALNLKIKDWQIKDWWLTPNDLPKRDTSSVRFKAGFELAEKGTVIIRHHSEAFGFNDKVFEERVAKLAQEIADYHEAHPEESNDEAVLTIPLQLPFLASAAERLVIKGRPGSGKSSFVRYLALCLAEAKLGKGQINLANLQGCTAGELTPIYIELRRFVACDYFPKDITARLTVEHLWNYITHEILDAETSGYADELKQELEQGQALLILDGLDEVPYPEGKLKARQEQLKSLAQSIKSEYSGCRVIVTSRPSAYENWKLPQYSEVTLAPFEDEQRKELARKLYQAIGLMPEEAETKAEDLNKELEDIDEELKDRPLFLTLMATLYYRRTLEKAKEKLPKRKGELYRQSILLLMERWTQSKKGALTLMRILGDKKPEELYVRLAHLAYDVHRESGVVSGPCEIKEGLLYSHLKPLGKYLAVDLIPYLNENAGLLVSPGQSEESEIFQFAHRSFQEYLAAEHLVEKCKEAESFELIRQHIEEKPELWRVPGAFVGDILTDTNRPRDIWLLLEDLLEGAYPTTANDPHWWSIWLAAKVMEEQVLDKLEARRGSEKDVCQKLAGVIVKLLETAQALPAVERAMYGRVLSKLGDPRKGVGTRKVMVNGREIEIPEIEWLEIPAPANGEFTMGADDQKNNPRRQEKLGYSFKMAKYPITYQQYQTFITNGDYDNPNWWQGFPEEYQPDPPNEQNFEFANHPRETISWYQAVAFSRWLTACYRTTKLPELPEGMEIRLPTETEWEYAARGTDEQIYPWGNEFDKNKVNTRESDINQTSAVGIYPDGASPFGTLDMSGNIWEWCMNKDAENHVLRGGAFDLTTIWATSKFRFLDDAVSDTFNCDFRLVVSYPMPLYLSNINSQISAKIK